MDICCVSQVAKVCSFSLRSWQSAPSGARCLERSARQFHLHIVVRIRYTLTPLLATCFFWSMLPRAFSSPVSPPHRRKNPIWLM
eukprot:510648-Pleurochrysis_carterae.AAC.1